MHHAGIPQVRMNNAEIQEVVSEVGVFFAQVQTEIQNQI